MSNNQIQPSTYAKLNMDKSYQMYREEATDDRKQSRDFLFDYHTLNTSFVAFVHQNTILKIHDLDEYFEDGSKSAQLFLYRGASHDHDHYC